MHKRLIILIALLACGPVVALPPLEGTTIAEHSDLSHQSGFVSRGDSVGLLLNAVGAKMNLAVVVSAKAQRKRVSGSFDLARPNAIIDRLASELGLVWYSDGQSLYVYESSEVRNAIGHLNHASVATLNEFLRKAGLADRRYAVRSGDASGTFYIAGPPVYVDIVINAAGYIDELYRGADANTQHVELIKLENSFVTGRDYNLRGQNSRLPGVADALAAIFMRNGEDLVVHQVMPDQPPVEGGLDGSVGPGDVAAGDAAATKAVVTGELRPSRGPTAQQSAVVVPYPETNSLLVRGTLTQLRMVKDLVAVLDVPRRQIELSLWIIDINKSDLDQLGVNWSGRIGVGNKLGVGLNEEPGGVSTLDGSRFLASVAALSRQGNASIVSRPVLLTQENVRAHFDSNHTFYTPLLAERSASLEAITYGTKVSVVPRISTDQQVEMQLQIEDGSAAALKESLPTVARTTIDTVARVPQSLSLLIGGYSRQAREEGQTRIPGLGRIPVVGGLFRHRSKVNENIVRVFLIQPRVVKHSAGLDESTIESAYGLGVGQEWQAQVDELRQRSRAMVSGQPAEQEGVDGRSD